MTGEVKKSNAEIQAAYRARRALEGLTEVRGIFLPPDLHPALKERAVRLLKRSSPKKRKPKELK